MSDRHPNLLRREESALLVIDVQEPFLRTIHDRTRLLENVVFLIRAATILDVPILATVQYTERMGGPVPEIASELKNAGVVAVDKMSFSAADSEECLDAIRGLGRRQIIVCGVETHICVAQTAMDLQALGYQVHVAADAVSSRTVEKHKLGMERIRDSGVMPCAAEAAAFEVLRHAGGADFKSILRLVKS